MKLIQERLTESFKKHASKNAIEYGDVHMSYEELNQKSYAVMQYILNQYGKGAHIGVLMNNRLNFIITYVGILRAGGVFVPIEVSFPDNRIAKLIKKCEVACVICEPEFLDRGLEEKGTCTFEKFEYATAYKSEKELSVQYEQDDPVYIYCTSGSTGEPKPVLGKNLSLTHFIAWEAHTFQTDDTFRFSQFTNVGFDVFLRDTLVSMVSGGCLCIPEKKEIILESSSLSKWINEQKISFIHCVPSIFALINGDSLLENDYADLKYILLAGEKITPELLKSWYEVMKDRVQLVNLYGPTETTLAKLFYRIKTEDQNKSVIPVGKPIDGAQVILLNDKNKQCDILETGEVYIRTPFRTLGYYKEEKLTSEVFIPYTFENGITDVLYKTGDLGKMLLDGNLELLGRKDRQVKIRGMRIELGEIENVILKHPAVKETVVVMKQASPTVQLLYAYIIANKKHTEDNINESLMEQLKQELPQYMIPAQLIEIDEMPRLLNGKIDFSKLKDPLEDMTAAVKEPKDDTEKKLLEIWSDVLGIDNIGVDDSFFEKGGNSLSLMNLVLNISEEFNVEMDFEQVALKNTIELQAEFIREASGECVVSITKAETKSSYKTLESQKRLYFMQQKDRSSCFMNLPSITKVTGKLEIDRLEAALNQVVKQQELLRTYFDVENSDIRQFVVEDLTVKLESFTLEPGEDIVEKAKTLVRPFELGKAPLFRSYVCQVSESEFYLIFDFHHIIFDGYSNEIFIRELSDFYQNAPVPELNIQFKDYAEFANSPAELEKMKQHEEYWVSQFDEKIKKLLLPEKKPAQDMKYSTNRVVTSLDTETLFALKDVAQHYNTTLFTVMLTGFYILLGNIGNEEDITVGIPVSGRNSADLERIVGMFVNTIAFRQFPVQEKTCDEFLMEVKDGFIKALANQNYQYEDLVNDLNKKSKKPIDSLFDIIFQMQNYKKENVQLKDICFERIPLPAKDEYKISFSVEEHAGQFQITVIYLEELFDIEFIDQLSKQYVSILKKLGETTSIKIYECLEELERTSELEADFDFE